MMAIGFIVAVVAVATVVATTASAAAMELSPADPRSCEPIVLTVRRAFTEDCQWRVEPQVRRAGEQIEVELRLYGNAICDQALIDRVFEIDIGSLPVGRYALRVHWSDSDISEHLTFAVGAKTDEPGDP